MNLQLLDCTLRDGGYINDWNFGNHTIRSVITRLDNAGIDIIECGFLDSRVEYDKNRSIYPDIPSIEKTLLASLPRHSMLVAMIDYGTFSKELLIPKNTSVLDGIRLIFKKEQADEALEYGAEIKRRGYKLFLNPVALSSYRDIELLCLIEKINIIMPCGMAIVDTYGLMFNEDIMKYIYLIHSNLNNNIILAYHTHNNLQMGNAHCISYIERNLQRTIVVDSSILGMGKNAGNACTELIASYVDKKGIKKLNLDHIFECAYTDISKFMIASNWGYSLDNLLTAIYDCSPNWIKFLTGKNTLSISGMRLILELLPFEKREISFFSKEKAERLYLDYMDKYVDDTQTREKIKSLFGKRKILLLCPGKTLKTYQAKINRYIATHDPIVITLNFITTDFKVDYVFISNSNRYSQAVGVLSDIDCVPPLIITSNIVAMSTLTPSYTLNYKTLYDSIQGDSSAGLFIALLKQMGITSVSVAGMDGFDENSLGNNYFRTNMSLGFVRDANQTLIEQLSRIIGNITVEWITPSKIKNALCK